VKLTTWDDSATTYYALPINDVGDQTLCIVFTANIDTPSDIQKVGKWLVNNVREDTMKSVEINISKANKRKAIKLLLV
jgi:hypothetical protein